jgi:hypothetical protein
MLGPNGERGPWADRGRERWQCKTESGVSVLYRVYLSADDRGNKTSPADTEPRLEEKMKNLMRVLCLPLSFLSVLAGCQMSLFYQTLGNKVLAPPLSIAPPSVVTRPGGVVTFIATGGTPPYTFSLAAVGTAPPAPTINSTTGAYIAGSTLGTDSIQVIDKTSAKATAKVTVTAAVTNVDYTVASASFPTTDIAGFTLAGGYRFTIQNIGVAPGTQQVSWWVFMSPTNTLGGGAAILENGTTGALGPGATANIGVSWTWPSVTGTYYLFVVLAANDDLNQSNNTFGPLTETLTAPQVDYTIVGPGGITTAGSTISGTFQIRNIGTNDGTQNVAWAVYASVFNVLNASAIRIASATTGPLNAGITSIPPIAFSSGPLASGNYYLIATVSSPEDVNPVNDTVVTAIPTAVGLNEAPSGLHDNPLLTNAFNLGVTLQPGMILSLAGSLLSSESDDIFAFNTGTATTITFSMVWTGSYNVNFQTMSGPSTYLSGNGVLGGSSLTWTWTVDVGNANRWLDIQNPALANVGPYTLLIQAN